MEGKSENKEHCVWYIGESVRTAQTRWDESYPLFLERFGVTHKVQVSEIPDPNSYRTQIVEAVVAGAIQAATNMTRERATEMAIGAKKKFTPFSYRQMSCVNLVHCGPREWGSMNGKQWCGWFRQNTKRHGTKPVTEVLM